MTELTEAEARVHWCPHVRINSVNRTNTTETIKRMTCFGAKCMMWRWVKTGNPDPPTGYCGLAGPTE